MKGLSSLTVDRGLCNTIAMKKTIIAGAALFTVSLLQADVGLLAALPWIGDGRQRGGSARGERRA